MPKEPTGFHIFRIILILGIFVLLLMLYWSSDLVEENIINLKEDVDQLKQQQSDLHEDLVKLQSNIHHAIVNTPSTSNTFENRPLIDASLPNILQDDPFYSTTLPKMLGPDFKPKGTFHNAILGKPDNLHPFSNWAQVAGWYALCIPSLARNKFGIYETYAPDLAIKMEERKNKDTGVAEFWVHLRDSVYWQPLQNSFFSESMQLAPHFLQKHQVTAHDFKFYFDAMMNPFVQSSGAVSLRTYYNDLHEIEVLDKLTFIVRWKPIEVQQADGSTTRKIKYIAKQLTGNLRPLASFVYQYFQDGTKIVADDSDPNTYRTNSVWAQNFAHHWAQNIIPSCGPWKFEGMTDHQIKFRRIPDYYFPLDALAEGIEIGFKDSADAIWADFQANKLDTYEIRSDQLLELEHFLKSPQYAEQSKNGHSIHRLDFVARNFTYVGWNESKPYFKSKKVRQAMTLAIDRNRIIQQNLNGMGIPINGPFYVYSSAYDKDIPSLPYDPPLARRLLEEEGWFDSKGQGVLEKEIDGKMTPFAFGLTYYVKNPNIKAICEYICTALKAVGINCTLNGLDVADLSNTFDDKSFDGLCLGWELGTPPEDPKQLWSSEGAKEKGSSNAISFANADIDKLIHKLEYESDPAKRIELYHQFDRIIHEEQPYTFLFTPKIALLYRNRVQNVFIPADRQDLIPGANVSEPQPSIFWLKSVASGF